MPIHGMPTPFPSLPYRWGRGVFVFNVFGGGGGGDGMLDSLGGRSRHRGEVFGN